MMTRESGKAPPQCLSAVEYQHGETRLRDLLQAEKLGRAPPTARTSERPLFSFWDPRWDQRWLLDRANPRHRRRQRDCQISAKAADEQVQETNRRAELQGYDGGDPPDDHGMPRRVFDPRRSWCIIKPGEQQEAWWPETIYGPLSSSWWVFQYPTG